MNKHTLLYKIAMDNMAEMQQLRKEIDESRKFNNIPWGIRALMGMFNKGSNPSEAQVKLWNNHAVKNGGPQIDNSGKAIPGTSFKEVFNPKGSVK